MSYRSKLIKLKRETKIQAAPGRENKRNKRARDRVVPARDREQKERPRSEHAHGHVPDVARAVVQVVTWRQVT